MDRHRLKAPLVERLCHECVLAQKQKVRMPARGRAGKARRRIHDAGTVRQNLVADGFVQRGQVDALGSLVDRLTHVEKMISVGQKYGKSRTVVGISLTDSGALAGLSGVHTPKLVIFTRE